MMLLSSLIAVGSAVAGLYASYYGSVPSGAAIVLACSASFGLVWVIGRSADAARSNDLNASEHAL
jgi:manganese/iron transport system permease protein